MDPGEFPTLCETCLGDNPYIRMTRDKFGKACKICERPFDVYRWRPGPKSRFKKTEICKTCAKLKNVCQTCILDLQYGLPVEVRDKALSQNDKKNLLDILPTSHINRNYMYEQLETETGLGRQGGLILPYNKISKREGGNDMLMKLQRRGPYFDRNLPHICSFYVKGTCTRGDACPYRHITRDKNELTNQNIKDRFYGINDPVAKKMLDRHNNVDTNDDTNRIIPKPPLDMSIRTLYIGKINYNISKEHIIDKFKDICNVESVNILHNKKCAFVMFDSRENAETIMNKYYGNLYLNNNNCTLNWATNKINKNIENNSTDTDNNNLNQNNNNNNKSSVNSNKNDEIKDEILLNSNEFTDEQKKILANQGLIEPKKPKLMDKTMMLPPGMKGYYETMNTHYNEANFTNNNTITPNMDNTDNNGNIDGIEYPVNDIYKNLNQYNSSQNNLNSYRKNTINNENNQQKQIHYVINTSNNDKKQ